MRITVLNFSKYNPRGDVKNPSWVRLERNWWADMFEWTADAQRIWFMLIGIVTDFETGTLETSSAFIAANLRIKIADVDDCIRFLCNKNRIKIDCDTPTLRPRDGDDTHTIVTRRDETGHNETGRDVRTVASPPARMHAPARVIDMDEPPHPADIPTAAPPGPALTLAPLVLPKAKRETRLTPPSTEGSRVWAAYADAYQASYGQVPPRNQRNNSLCKQLVQRLGVDDAERVVRFYLTHRKSYYVTKTHQLEACVADCEGLRTQMLAGHRITSADAKRVDDGQTNEQTFAIVKARLQERGIM